MRSRPRRFVLAMGAAAFWTAGLCGAGQETTEELPLEELLDRETSGTIDPGLQLERAASKQPQPVTETPSAVTIITAEEIAAQGYRTLDEALVSVPGFYVSNLRTTDFIGVRGFSRTLDFNNRLLVLLDGHTSNEVLLGSANVGNRFGLSMDLVDRIEVAPGPGSAVYGTNAMFATINVVTKDGADIDGVRVGGEVGSYGRAVGSVIYGSALDNGTDVLASIRSASVDGEFDNWEDFNEGFLQIRRGDFTLRGKYNGSRAGIQRSGLESSYDEPGIHSVLENGFGEARYERDLTLDKHMMTRAYFNYQRAVSTRPNEDGTRRRTKSWADWGGVEGRFVWSLAAANQLSVGIEAQRRFQVRYRREILGNAPQLDGDFPLNVLSAYAQDQHQLLPNLALTLGLRADQHGDDISAVNPRLAVVYHPFRETTLKALYGKAFRAPTMLERRYELPGSIARNPGLAPETIQTFEGVLMQSFGNRVMTTASVYRYLMDDLIELEIDFETRTAEYQNMSQIQTDGVELTGRFHLPRDIEAHVQYSHQDATDRVTGEPVTNSPEHQAKASVVVPVLDYLSVAAEGFYESERRTVDNQMTDAFFLANMTLTVVPPGVDGFKTSISVKNVLDEKYVVPTGIMLLVPQEGRDVTVRATAHF